MAPRKYTCNQCNKGLSSKSHLTRHIKTVHENERKYRCTICDYAAKSGSDLRKHLICKHSNKRPHQCQYCNYAAKTSARLIQHFKFKHSNIRSHWCLKCDYVAKTPGHLNQHIMYKHSDERPHKCKYCDYAAKRRGDLTKHINFKHSDEYPYRCLECEYAGKTSDSLNQHIRNHHSKDFPFHCPECEYSAKVRVYITKHILYKHSIERPHQCLKCKYAAKTKEDLSKHVQSTHSDERLYQCTECEYTAKRSSNLSKHLRLHEISMKWKFVCPYGDGCTHVAAEGEIVCNQKFPSQGSLDVHIQKCHTMEGIQKRFHSEQQMATFLEQKGILFTRDWENVISFNHCPQLQLPGARSRPDFFLTDLSVKLGIAVLVGNDEFAHRRYQTDCEFSRMLKIAGCLFQNPQMPVRMIYIRFNPHFYTKDGVVFDPSLETRYERLLKLLNSLPEREGLLVIYLYYDTKDGQLCIFQKENSEATRAIQECYIHIE